ncbi:PTS system mannose/fructose/sorbose family transporter subunit IID [Oleidesulfovibrio sp.]|uniref:PTS system mannose/fructose/sorbose family transporter subunit IID n=1 Tax=Oleidesulfovibrio sp. TaxID=2909707 RepID=UPI003A8BC2C0
MTIDARTLLRCFLRTYTVGAAFNTRGMQNIGLVHAMEPGLAVIYPDPAKRREARKRYIRHYNTHPFWTPLLVGTFLSLEMHIAAQTFPPQMLRNLKDTTTYTLSAIGDSVFGGTMLVSWSLATCCLLVSGYETAAFALGLTLFTLLQLFKFFTFIAGLREGLKVLNRLKSWNLINWGERLKAANAVLAGVLLWLLFPAHDKPVLWAAAVASLGLFAVLIGRLGLSRMLLLFIFTAVILALPFASAYVPVEWQLF